MTEFKKAVDENFVIYPSDPRALFQQQIVGTILQEGLLITKEFINSVHRML